MGSYAITNLSPANVGLLTWKPLMFSMWTQIKTSWYIKPNTMIATTGYKWNTRILEIHGWQETAVHYNWWSRSSGGRYSISKSLNMDSSVGVGMKYPSFSTSLPFLTTPASRQCSDKLIPLWVARRRIERLNRAEPV